MTIYRRRWHFRHFFQGDMHIDIPDIATEEEVRRKIEDKYPGGNWDKHSLKKGKKVKLRG